jgi:hypothetical protein
MIGNIGERRSIELNILTIILGVNSKGAYRIENIGHLPACDLRSAPIELKILAIIGCVTFEGASKIGPRSWHVSAREDRK